MVKAVLATRLEHQFRLEPLYILWLLCSMCICSVLLCSSGSVCITESRPLKNVARENANKPEKKKRACVTSCRPVNRTVNHVIPCVRCVHKYCFLLREPKRSAIHRRIDVISRVILIKLYCLKIGQM